MFLIKPKIILSSTNEAKKQAVISVLEKIFGTDFELVCADIDSGVSATPFSAEECMQGCKNRVAQIMKLYPDAQYWVGAEGGLQKFDEQYFLGGWVLVQNSHEIQSWGSSSWVQIPGDIITNLSPEKKLNEVIDYSKFPRDLMENRVTLGTNGLLTNGIYTRIDEFRDALKIAFSRFGK